MDRLNKATTVLDKIAEWSLYILIFALPFSKSIIEITITTALVSLIVKKMITRERFFTNDKYVNILLLILVVTTLPSLLNSSYLALSVRAFFSKILKFAALFLITKEIINTRTKLINFIIMAALSCVIILIDGYIQLFITHCDILHNYVSFKYLCYSDGSNIYFFRGYPTASFPFPNDFAAWILMFIFPVGFFSFFGKGYSWKKRAFLGIVFVCLLYFFILTKVRSVWLGFLTAAGLLSFLRLKKMRIFFLVILVLSVIFINKVSITDIVSLASFGDRTTMWKNGWEIFKKHPIIGNGINTFFNEYRFVRQDRDRGKGSYAHNCYLQMASDVGLIGLASFLLFITAVIIKAFKSVKVIKDPLYYSLILGIDVGLVAFLVHSFFDTNLYSLNLAALFWISAGILLAAVKIAESPA